MARLKTTIALEFFKETLAESAAQTSGPREVILSEYLISKQGMDRQAAVKVIKDTFENSFDKGQFINLSKNLVKHLDSSKNFTYQGNIIPAAYQHSIQTLERVGKYEDADGNKMDEIIRNVVVRRLKGVRNEVEADWRKLLDNKLGTSIPLDEDETRAREEKAVALKELAESRFSVLLGPAGTGKPQYFSYYVSTPLLKTGDYSYSLLLAKPVSNYGKPQEKALVQLPNSYWSTIVMMKRLAYTGCHRMNRLKSAKW